MPCPNTTQLASSPNSASTASPSEFPLSPSSFSSATMDSSSTPARSRRPSQVAAASVSRQPSQQPSRAASPQPLDSTVRYSPPDPFRLFSSQPDPYCFTGIPGEVAGSNAPLSAQTSQSSSFVVLHPPQAGPSSEPAPRASTVASPFVLPHAQSLSALQRTR